MKYTWWIFWRYLENPAQGVKWHWLSLCFASGAVLSKETGIMSLAINVGYGLLGCIQQKYKYKTWKNTFKRLFWTDIFTVKSTKVFREGKVFQNVLLTAFGYIFCPYSGAKFKSARIFCPRQPCCIWQESFNQVRPARRYNAPRGFSQSKSQVPKSQASLENMA